MRALVLLIVALLASSARAEPPKPPVAPPGESPLAALVFLVGDWEASGGGEPGRAAGRFSFQWAAERHALIRRNEAVTASGRHADVMLVYAAPDGAVRAVYVDSEGHAIDYTVTVLPGQRRAVFESGGEGPRFRLWYQLSQDGSLATGFQVSQPGSSEFKSYLEGVAHPR